MQKCSNSCAITIDLSTAHVCFPLSRQLLLVRCATKELTLPRRGWQPGSSPASESWLNASRRVASQSNSKVIQGTAEIIEK